MTLNERPFIASLFSLIAGILVLIGGSILMIIGYGLIGGNSGVFGLFGMVLGIIMIIVSFMLRSRPQQHIIYGIIILTASILSWVGAAGGLLFGSILGIIGGILSIIWKPSIPTTQNQTYQPQTCPNCGAALTSDVRFCPKCGKEVLSKSINN